MLHRAVLKLSAFLMSPFELLHLKNILLRCMTLRGMLHTHHCLERACRMLLIKRA